MKLREIKRKFRESIDQKVIDFNFLKDEQGNTRKRLYIKAFKITTEHEWRTLFANGEEVEEIFL